MTSDAQPEPSDSNYAKLNEDFYNERPWDYFRHRLLHLAAIAETPGETPCRGPISIGPFTIQSRIPDSNVGDDSGRHPTPAQAFVAVEAEILLHHSAETLLRLIHAHAEPNPCPWLRMSAVKGAGPFKRWVKTLLAREDLPELTRQAFGASENHPEESEHEAGWIRLFARHFLDSAPYNAAKHGMSLSGGAELRTMTIGDLEVQNAKGSSVSWLTMWPRNDPNRPPRWTRVSRLFSPEAFMMLTYVATMLMESVWTQGRIEHLDEPDLELHYRSIGPPQYIFDLLGVGGHTLDERYEPLAYEGEKREMIVKFLPPRELLGRWQTDPGQ
ncbi:MAG: hypothetical protein ACLP50_05775 [Solirubrobacteraceae bacterium]